MKTHAILFQHTGENANTAKSPVGVYVEGSVDLAEEVVVCRYFDDDGLTTVKKWAVQNVDLPDWMEPQEWLRDVVAWRYTMGMGASADWSAATLRALKEMSCVQRLACIKLLKTKTFRSDFRKSLRAQLEAWIAADERKYDSPFSPRQWDSLCDVYVSREAKQVSERLYQNREYAVFAS